MESICRTLRFSNFPVSTTFSPPPLPFNPSSKPLISFRCSSNPLLSIRCSHNPGLTYSKTVRISKPLSSLIAAAATAAALLLARFHFPLPAIAAIVSAPPAESVKTVDSNQALSDEEKEHKLEAYLDSHPDDGCSLRALLELKFKAGKLQDAIFAIDRLMLLEPNDKDLPLLKAHLQSYSGDFLSSRQGFEKLLAEDPLNVEAYHGLVMLEREVDGGLDEILKRVEAALETCKKLKRKEDVRDFKLLIAQIKIMESKYDESLVIYQELVREEPRDFRPYLCQGIVYSLLQKKEEAEKQFEKYKRLVPKGHPYARFFDENMNAMKMFGQFEEKERKNSLKI